MGTQPTEVELTSKKWKALMLVSAIVMMLGIPTCMVEIGSSNGEPSFSFGVAMFIGGSIGYLAARVGAWWNHG